MHTRLILDAAGHPTSVQAESAGREDASRGAGRTRSAGPGFWLPALGLTALSSAGFLLILYATTWGPWAYSDSVEFIGSARNLLAGRGLGLFSPSGRFMPLQLHPPLYPLLLAALARGGLEIVSAARLLNAFLFGVFVALVGLAFGGLSRSPLLALVFSTVILANTELVGLFSGAMTEPVFFVIAMGAVCLLAIATAPGMHGWIPLAGILVGLSILARYSGLALLAAGFVFILLFRRGSVRTWTLGAVLFVLLASLPLAVWLALAPSNGEPPLGALIPTGAEVWSRLAPVRLEVTRYVWNWLPFTEYLAVVSHRARLVVTIAVLAAAVGLFIATDLRRRHLGLGGLSSSISGRAVSLLVLFALSYVALLAGAFICRDAQPDLIGRTLLPISLGLSGAAFALIWFIGETWLGGRWAVWALAGIGAIVAVRGASPTLELVSSLHANGGGYTSAHWQDSGAIRGLREINPDLAIVTNEAAAVQLYTGRSPYNLLELGPLTSPPDQAGVGDVRSLAIPALPRGEGALVLFDSIYGQWLTVNEAETRARVEALTQGMTVYSDYWDGTIYLYPPE